MQFLDSFVNLELAGIEVIVMVEFSQVGHVCLFLIPRDELNRFGLKDHYFSGIFLDPNVVVKLWMTNHNCVDSMVIEVRHQVIIKLTSL